MLDSLFFKEDGVEAVTTEDIFVDDVVVVYVEQLRELSSAMVDILAKNPYSFPYHTVPPVLNLSCFCGIAGAYFFPLSPTFFQKCILSPAKFGQNIYR